MEGFALPSAPVPNLRKVEFTVSPTSNNEAYTIRAWGEEPLYPHSQVAEMHEFIQQPKITALLGWFGIRSSHRGSQHTVEIPTVENLRKKIETINCHLDYPVPQLALSEDIIDDATYLKLHSQGTLPVCEQVLGGTDWKAWHHTVHDLFTHATSWILAPRKAHSISQAAAFQAHSRPPEAKAEISELIDELYSLDCLGNCIQAQHLSHLLNDPKSRSTWRIVAELSALSAVDFDFFARWSFWQASQDRIEELGVAVRAVQSVKS